MSLQKIPALFDLHVHFRDPGFTEKEDIFSGAAAMKAGGYSGVVCMPNTSPPVDNKKTIEYIRKKSMGQGVNIYPAACITKGMSGEELADFAEYERLGIKIITDDGKPVKNNELMRRAFIEAAKHNLLIADHCEDLDIIDGGIINRGEVSEALGVKGMDRLSEDLITARDIILAEELGTRIHICHVSTSGSVELIRAAKARGVKVTAETAPHYFIDTEKKLLTKDADYRMNPPLRTEQDRAAIEAAVIDGTIDCICTDHAPHTPSEKADFYKAPNGVIGLETAFAASYTYLVKTGKIPLERLIELMSTKPREIYGLLPSTHFVKFDLDESFIVNPERMKSKGRNCVFKGERLYGVLKN
ncbi:MAG: dihydroorotase [Ruminococcus sp.]|jgi:dihydroorotase|nr:dihydroorotase [Ruminococcus sp.]